MAEVGVVLGCCGQPLCMCSLWVQLELGAVVVELPWAGAACAWGQYTELRVLLCFCEQATS